MDRMAHGRLGATIDTFLQDTASQLTDYGLTQVSNALRILSQC